MNRLAAVTLIIGIGPAVLAHSQTAPLRWPPVLAADGSQPDISKWTETTISKGGASLRVRHPQDWTRGPSVEPLRDMQFTASSFPFSATLVSLDPSGMDWDSAVTQAELGEFAQGVASDHGPIERYGQARSVGRLWFWFEFKPKALKAPKGMEPLELLIPSSASHLRRTTLGSYGAGYAVMMDFYVVCNGSPESTPEERSKALIFKTILDHLELKVR